MLEMKGKGGSSKKSRQPGPAMAKAKAHARNPYKDVRPELRLLLNVLVEEGGSKCGCDDRGPAPPPKPEIKARNKAIKRLKELEGGFDPSILCEEHHIALSASGSCSMCPATLVHPKHIHQETEEEPPPRRKATPAKHSKPKPKSNRQRKARRPASVVKINEKNRPPRHSRAGEWHIRQQPTPRKVLNGLK